MKRITLVTAALLGLAACSNQQQVQTNTLAAITIMTDALPCYLAVQQAIQTGNDATKALTASSVLATNAACLSIGAQATTAIETAITTNAPVAVVPATTPMVITPVAPVAPVTTTPAVIVPATPVK